MLVTILWSHDTVILLFIQSLVQPSHNIWYPASTGRQTDRRMYQVNGNCATQSDSSDILLPIYQSTRCHIPECHKILTCAVFRISDSVRAGRYGDRIPVEARFSLSVQNGPGAHPASYSMGTVSFPGVKRPERGVDHAPSSSAEVKQRVQLYLYFPLGLHGLFLGDLYLKISVLVHSPASALSRHICLLVCVVPDLALKTLTSCPLANSMEQSPS